MTAPQEDLLTIPLSSRFRMEWFLLVSGLVLAGLLIGGSIYTDHRNISRREHDRLTVQAGVIEKSVGSVFSVVDRVLLGLRADLPAWQAEPNGMARANQRLRAFASAMRGVRTLLVLDADGDVIAANRPELLSQNFSYRDYFQTARDHPDRNRLYVSPPFLTSLGVWSMNLVRVISGPNGEFAGIVSATLDPDDLRFMLGAVLYEKDMWAALAHGDGLQIVMEPDRPGQTGKDLAQPGSFFSRHMASGQPAQVLEGVVAATGENRMMALRTIRPADVPMDIPLVAAVGRDMGALYADWRRLAWLEGGLFVLLAGVGIPGLRLSQQRRWHHEEQRAQSAAALAESERFMRSLIDIIPGMAGYWDADLRCRFANIAYLEWFGRKPETMDGMQLHDLLGEELFRRNEPYIRAALAGQPQHFERTLVKADGSTGYTWAHYMPDVVDGRVLGFFVLISDVTQLKQAQLLLEASNAVLEKRSVEAEAASRAKSAFLANMSHEIRTPMNAVLGLLQLLQFTRLDARQLDYVGKAEDAAQSLLSLLNDILDFSKVEADKLKLDNSPFRLDELLRNLSVVLASALQRKEVEVLFRIGPGIPRVLCGDGLRLQQVLLNLAGNAIKFTERGEVVIVLTLIEDSPDAVGIEFSVRDTGIGIAADVLPRLFSAFEQADSSTTRRFGGSGLGLAISRRLVQLMGGDLTVDSTLGQGSDFHFSLRFRRDAQTRTLESVAEQETAATPCLRVLIVDDNATAREVLAATAASFGWQVESAISGPQALERLSAAEAADQPFDVLCVDWIMPGMDGWETVQHLRANHPTRLPAILMITAHGRALMEERLAGQPDLLDGFLVKPVTPSTLFDAVAQATGGESVTTDARTDKRARLTAHPLAGLHILLVEDHPLNQQVARELLAHAGASVDVASDGQQGIEAVKAAATPFDAILMDIQMPGMDGYTATHLLRTDMGVTTPIIAMTANALAADRDACLAAGMNDHIGKPIDTRELIACLLHHCRGETADHGLAPANVPDLPAMPEGFDLPSALARVNGDRELFASLARRFGEDGRALIDNATAALRRGDRGAAARELHTLKGLAGTLGAMALVSRAAAVEAAFKSADSDEDDARLSALAEAFHATVDRLLAAADAIAPATPADGSADPERILELLGELDDLLAQQNMRALDMFAALKREAGTRLASSLQPLDEALLKFDFVAAREKAANLNTILTR